MGLKIMDGLLWYYFHTVVFLSDCATRGVSSAGAACGSLCFKAEGRIVCVCEGRRRVHLKSLLKCAWGKSNEI